jgi:hypothetical protein
MSAKQRPGKSVANQARSVHLLYKERWNFVESTPQIGAKPRKTRRVDDCGGEEGPPARDGHHQKRVIAWSSSASSSSSIIIRGGCVCVWWGHRFRDLLSIAVALRHVAGSLGHDLRGEGKYVHIYIYIYMCMAPDQLRRPCVCVCLCECMFVCEAVLLWSHTSHPSICRTERGNATSSATVWPTTELACVCPFETRVCHKLAQHGICLVLGVSWSAAAAAADPRTPVLTVSQCVLSLLVCVEIRVSMAGQKYRSKTTALVILCLSPFHVF